MFRLTSCLRRAYTIALDLSSSQTIPDGTNIVKVSYSNQNNVTKNYVLGVEANSTISAETPLDNTAVDVSFD